MDPPEEVNPTLRSLSTGSSDLLPLQRKCSHDPPENDDAMIIHEGYGYDAGGGVYATGRQRGLYPAEMNEQSTNNTSCTSPIKSNIGDAMMMIYEPSVLTTPECFDGALVKVDPKDIRRGGFDHCFVTVPFKDRLSVLFATLRRSSERKVIVICSSWESSQFHSILFKQLEMLHVYELHENMEDVTRAYDEFVYHYPGILFASDIALREFEIPPNVDYIIQYEPPLNPTDYIFRMSNAKIYRTSCHKSLLFLTPDELKFLTYFGKKVPNEELEARKVSEFQGSVEKLVSKHSELNDYAWKAFRAYLDAYENHSHGDIYNHTRIDEAGVRRAFGDPCIPKDSAKYFVYNKKPGEVVEKKGDDDVNVKSDGKHKAQPWRKRHISKPPQEVGNGTTWMEKEKVWRSKETKPWPTRDKKTWKHAHKTES